MRRANLLHQTGIPSFSCKCGCLNKDRCPCGEGGPRRDPESDPRALVSTYASGIPAFTEASQHCPYVSKSQHTKAICSLPAAEMRLGRYMNGVLFPSVISATSIPAAEKPK